MFKFTISNKAWITILGIVTLFFASVAGNFYLEKRLLEKDVEHISEKLEFEKEIVAELRTRLAKERSQKTALAEKLTYFPDPNAEYSPNQNALAAIRLAIISEVPKKHWTNAWKLINSQSYVETGHKPYLIGQAGEKGPLQIMPFWWRNTFSEFQGLEQDWYINTVVALRILNEYGVIENPELVGYYNAGPDFNNPSYVRAVNYAHKKLFGQLLFG